MTTQIYATTPVRAVLAVVVGATIASLSWFALACAVALISGSDVDRALTEIIGVVAAAAYFLGLPLIGVPVWAVLHARGSRSPKNAAATGAILSFVVASPLGSPVWVLTAAAIGTLVGLVIWRVAYRRAA